MLFMNRWDIEKACEMREDHPILGPAARTLRNLRDAADASSDGWAYWPAPARAARLLMELLDSSRENATETQLRKAYAQLRALKTRSGLVFDIEEPAIETTGPR